MPFYIFENEDTGEVKEVFQSMDEDHSYSENGVKWRRVFVNPQAAFDTKIDPHSQKDFTEKTGKKRGNLGNLFDASKEASEKRAKDCGGKDPVKEKYYQDYSKKRGGKAHPDKIKNVGNLSIDFD